VILMPVHFQRSRSEQARTALYRRLQRTQPTVLSGFTTTVDLSPLLGRARGRVVISQGLYSDLAALIGDRQRAMQALLDD
jgi:hypothetical protein